MISRLMAINSVHSICILQSGQSMRSIVLPIFVSWLFSASIAAADVEAAKKAFVEEDYSKAYRLARVDADEGNAEAQVWIGSLYAYGRGVSQNDAEAAKWFERAARQGDPSGMYALGMVLLVGKGVPQDETKGAELVERAAAAGFNPATTMLSMLYEAGIGVKKNPTKAEELRHNAQEDPFVKYLRRRILDEDQKKQ